MVTYMKWRKQIVGLLFIVIIIGIIMLFHSPKVDKSPSFLNDIYNMQNGGVIVQNNTFICYCAVQDSENYRVAVLKDGEHITSINDVHRCYAIWCDWLYYAAGRENCLYRINFNTNERQCLTDFNCSEVVITNEKLYITSGAEQHTGLYIMNHDGSEIEQVCDYSISNIVPYDDCVYFCREHKLQKIDILTKEVQVFDFDGGVSRYCLCKEKIIFWTPSNCLKQYDFQKEKTTNLIQAGEIAGVVSTNIYEDCWISSTIDLYGHGKTIAVNFGNGRVSTISSDKYSGLYVTNNGIIGEAEGRFFCLDRIEGR